MAIIIHHLGSIYYALEWIARLTALVIVPMRRKPAAATAWLLLIFMLPVVGVVLFVAIGSPRFPAWRAQRFQRLLPFFEEVSAKLGRDPATLGAIAPAAALIHYLGHLPATGGNSLELIDDYDTVIERLVADIDGAREQVSILIYIFADDSVGQKVIAALGRAALRGVACRAIVDAVGSHHWIRETMRQLRDAGVDAREALPFRLLARRTRRDMRNHRKLFLIDGEIGYAGSQNIVAKDFKPGIVNRELVARVTGPVVAEIAAMISADWFLETEAMPCVPRVPEATGTACLQLLPSGADYPLEGFETLLIWQLHQATKRAIVVTPYFIPDDGLLGAMATATARGVEIDLVVSGVVDQRVVNLAQCSYYDELLVSGVRVHLFRDFFLHAKNVSIDGSLAVVGSSNVDLRSFQLNEEASLILLDAASVASVEAVQRGYLEGSDCLNLDDWRRRSRVRQIAENLARLISAVL